MSFTFFLLCRHFYTLSFCTQLLFPGFCTQKRLRTCKNFFIQALSHIDPLTHNILRTQILFCTERLSHRDEFTHKAFTYRRFWAQKVLTHGNFYTETFLRFLFYTAFSHTAAVPRKISRTHMHKTNVQTLWCESYLAAFTRKFQNKDAFARNIKMTIELQGERSDKHSLCESCLSLLSGMHLSNAWPEFRAWGSGRPPPKLPLDSLFLRIASAIGVLISHWDGGLLSFVAASSKLSLPPCPKLSPF